MKWGQVCHARCKELLELVEMVGRPSTVMAAHRHLTAMILRTFQVLGQVQLRCVRRQPDQPHRRSKQLNCDAHSAAAHSCSTVPRPSRHRSAGR